ncbi:hypothetical protein [Pradoshia sp.]
MGFYIQLIKSTIMPFFITIVLLIITAGFWGGIPLFILPGILYETGLPRFVQLLVVCLSAGVCFSIVCMPLLLSFSKAYAISKGKAMLNPFLLSQGILVLVAAILFAIMYFAAISMAI